MKGRFFLGAAVIGAFLFGFAAVSQAGGWMDRSGGAGDEMKAVERMEEPGAIDSNSWEYGFAVETGNLTPAAEPGHSTAREIAPVLWDQPLVTPEAGGLKFREVDAGQ